MKSMREDLKAVERLRKTAEPAVPDQERDKSARPWAGAVKATAFWRIPVKCVAFHDILFAYRKTAVQVSPYGGRLFICRTNRCVCRCGPASAPEHHPLCGRQAASPGEYDIPDGLPDRRTGHGRGLFRQRFSHRQQCYDLLQQLDLQATLYGSFVVFFETGRVLDGIFGFFHLFRWANNSSRSL